MRVLYLSQVLAHDHPDRAKLPDERVFLSPLFEALGVDGDIVDVTRHAPPDPSNYAGVMIGGSVGSVHDGEPWRARLLDWMAAHMDVPLLGMCGGHQILARVHGARVERMPKPQVGVWPLALSDVPGFGGRVIQMHGEAVVELPAGATLWAEDAFGIQALRYPGHRWSVQFHPELSAEIAASAGRSLGATDETWQPDELALAVADGRVLIRHWLDGLA